MNQEIDQLITVLGKDALKEPQLHSFLSGDCQAATGIQAYFSRLLCRWRALDRTSEVTQSCLTLCDPMDCSPPGSSVHGNLQGRILEWAAIFFSRGSS